jgi:hypothetical protein
MTFALHLRTGTVVNADGDRLVYTATDPRILAVMNGPNTAFVCTSDNFDYALVS